MSELFFTVKVGLVSHDKWRSILALGAERGGAASALWLAGMARTSQAQLGGRVEASWPVQELADWPVVACEQAAEDLVAAGLWERDGDGWQIHDFLDHQLPAARAVLSANAEPDDEPPPGLSPADRKRWHQARRAARARAKKRDANRAQRDGQRDAVTAKRDGERDERDAERDGNTPQRDANSVTESVTRHAVSSRSVTLSGTPRHASPFFLRDLDPERSDAREGERDAEERESHAPSRVTLPVTRHADEDRERGEGEAFVGFCEVVRAATYKAYRDRGLKAPPECSMGTSHHPRIVAIAKSLEDVESLDAALRGFFASPKAAPSYPLRWLENNPNEYLVAGRQTALQAPGATTWTGPEWMPGGPKAVTDKTLAEVMEGLPALAEAYIEKTGGHHGAKPPELADPRAHAATWRDLAIWACSRAHRCRMGDRDTAPQPGYLVSKAFKIAVRGWIADPLAVGRDGSLCMRVLIEEPERMWAEGQAVSS